MSGLRTGVSGKKEDASGGPVCRLCGRCAAQAFLRKGICAGRRKKSSDSGTDMYGPDACGCDRYRRGKGGR